VVFLDFWGIWCGPCLHALPTVEKLRAKYEPRGVVFLSLHTPGEEEDIVRRFLSLKKMSVPFALDRSREKDDDNKNGVTAERYGVNGYPTVVLIDRTGKIALRTDDKNIESEFEPAAKELGINLKDKAMSEEQASRVIERCLDRSIEKLLMHR